MLSLSKQLYCNSNQLLVRWSCFDKLSMMFFLA